LDTLMLLLIIIVVVGFVAVISVLAAIKNHIGHITPNLYIIREEITKCNEHLKSMPGEFDNILSRLGDVVSAIDPEFDEKRSKELEEKLRSMAEGYKGEIEANKGSPS
jgi:hypothetical protein